MEKNLLLRELTVVLCIKVCSVHSSPATKPAKPDLPQVKRWQATGGESQCKVEKDRQTYWPDTQ